MRYPILALACLSITVQSSPARAASTTVVISEFRTRGPNGANDEFVELFNKSAGAVDISGYKISRSNAAGTTTVIKTIPPGTTIASRRFYLLTNNGVQGYSGAVAGDTTYNQGIDDDGGLALLTAGDVVVDMAGMSSGSAHVEPQPLPPMSLNVNQSYERKNGGCSPLQDTDNNLLDFNINGSTSNPQRSSTVCNPCAGVVCNSPPSEQCHVVPGTCVAGTCNYQPRAVGAACNDGNACTRGDTCNALLECVSGGPEPCTTPPLATCSNAQTLVTYNVPGTCSSASGCSYTTTSTSCQFGCNSTTRACNPDPCTSVSCTTPPNDCYQAAGTCSGGTCTYPPKAVGASCSDGNGCTTGDSCNGAGTCRAGTPVNVDDSKVCTTDACVPATGQITHTPVANGTNCDDGNLCNGVSTCQSGTCAAGTAVTCNGPAQNDCFEPTGTCNPATGACNYPPKAPDSACNDAQRCTAPDTCDGNGVCNGSTVVCGSRAPTCVDANTSRAYSSGVCQSSDGTCAYTETDTSCAAGCNSGTGLCNNDPCATVTCNSAPSQCHIAPGQCAGGTCSYSLKPSGADCDDANGCTASDQCSAAGECSGTPRVCNSPEAARCLDADTSRGFNPAGTCEAGECKYTAVDTDCGSGCNTTTGLCNGDPCVGKNCDQPPSQCHLDVGSCANGTCSYERKAAGATCDDQSACTERDSCSATGQCAGEPKVCNTPPAATCVNGSTSRTFSAAGMCTAATGECTYSQTDTACANGCDSGTGRCTGDPCGSVTCNQPPGACSLDVGDCNNGTCSYGPKPSGVRCDDGEQCSIDETCNGSSQCSGGTRDPGCGGADGGIDGGTDGSLGSAGSAGRGGSGGTVDSGTRPDAGAGKGGAGVVTGDDDGCGCRVPGSNGGRGALLALAALSWLVARRRRRP